MKILLIQPPMTLLKTEIKSVVFPLGLAYIAATLEKSGYDVEVLDSVVEGQENDIVRDDMIHFGLDWPVIHERIKKSRPDVVGIGCLFSSQSDNAYKVAEIVKKVSPNILVLTGGAHPSSVPKDVLLNDNIDFAILGEGEKTLINLLKVIEENQENEEKSDEEKDKNFKQIKGLAFKDNENNISINNEREYIENIDEISLPARHLFPMDLYLNTNMSHGTDLMRKPLASMITSRGCPYNCVYCSVHTVWGRKYRPRSPKNVVDEIEHLVNKYGVKEIHFEDDNLTLKRDRTIEICKEIIKRKINIKWTTPNGVAIWTLDREVLTWMKKAGCYKLCFGIESGDTETQKFIRKSVPFKKCKNIIREANRLGIWTHGFFIIGFPFEDMNAINNTLRYAIRSDLDIASFFLATPYPKTDLYTIMDQNGMVKDLTWNTLRVSSASINTKYFTRSELTQLQKTLFQKFVFHRILNFFNLTKLGYRLKRLKSKEDIIFIWRFVKRFIQIVK